MMDGPRSLRPEEFDDLMVLVNSIFRKDKPPTMAQEFPTLFERKNWGNLLVICEDGRPVAHVGVCIRDVCILGVRERIGSVGSVGTDPSYRRRGYATKLLELAERRIREQGGDLMYISGSRGLYHRFGATYCERMFRGDWTRTTSVPAHPSVTLRPWREADVQRMTELHEREPIRFLRSKRDFDLARKAVTAGPPEWQWKMMVLETDGEVLAWLVVRKREGRAEILEYNGARRAVLAGLPQVAETMETSSVHFPIFPSDAPMLGLCRRFGVPTAMERMSGHTLKIVDFPRLMERYRPFLAARLDDEELAALSFDEDREKDVYTIRAGGESFAIEGSANLVRFVYRPVGEEGNTPIAPESMRSLVDRLFPLPYVWFGLNYV